MTDRIKKLCEFIEESDNIVFFGGAGVSTESGVPDFRSTDGLYNQHDVRFDGYEPEYLLSHECLMTEPKVFYEFYRQKLDSRSIEPNMAHRFLAELEKKGKLSAVITQNIDGLHQKAGSRRVCELHGTSGRNYCMKCGKEYPGDFIFLSDEAVPRCACGGMIRCDVTLYGESLPEESVRDAIEYIISADMIIIGGTSLAVYPAASFVRYFRGRHRAIINRDHIDVRLNPAEDVEINDSIGKVFGEVAEYFGMH